MKPVTAATRPPDTTSTTTTEDFSEALPSYELTCDAMFSESSLIVGGKFSLRKQFPWFVSIYLKAHNGEFIHKSSGSLVSTRFIVTTAYAVATVDRKGNFIPVSTDSVRLYVGEKTFKSSEMSGVQEVKKISIYPQAKMGEPNVFDFAVIKMKKKVQLSSVIFPICLKKFTPSNHVGETAYAVGCNSDHDGSRKKKHVPLKIESKDGCRKFYGDYIDHGDASKYFCATGRKDNVPVIYDASLYMKLDEKWHLIGMLNMRATHDKPILYEDISEFVEWIDNEMGN